MNICCYFCRKILKKNFKYCNKCKKIACKQCSSFCFVKNKNLCILTHKCKISN